MKGYVLGLGISKTIEICMGWFWEYFNKGCLRNVHSKTYI